MIKPMTKTAALESALSALDFVIETCYDGELKKEYLEAYDIISKMRQARIAQQKVGKEERDVLRRAKKVLLALENGRETPKKEIEF